jgi:hypothetical protein
LGLRANGRAVVSERRDNVAAWPRKHATLAIALIAGAVSACSSAGNNPLTVFVDPGKYQYYSCEQIAANRKHWSTKEQELQALMDKAEQGAGGAIVNVLAYKSDHIAASEEVKVLDVAARAKNCENPANWRSNSAVR